MIFGRICAKKHTRFERLFKYTELKNIEKKNSTVFGSNIALLYLFCSFTIQLNCTGQVVVYFIFTEN